VNANPFISCFSVIQGKDPRATFDIRPGMKIPLFSRNEPFHRLQLKGRQVIRDACEVMIQMNLSQIQVFRISPKFHLPSVT